MGSTGGVDTWGRHHHTGVTGLKVSRSLAGWAGLVVDGGWWLPAACPPASDGRPHDERRADKTRLD